MDKKRLLITGATFLIISIALATFLKLMVFNGVSRGGRFKMAFNSNHKNKKLHNNISKLLKNNRDVPASFPLSSSDFIRISSKFGYRKHPVLNKLKKHNGIDLVAKEGRPVYATGNGKVTVAGYQKGYGNYVVIAHKGRIKTLYGHLKKYKVNKHQRVKRGDIIGYVGQTGMATGPHLHYEMWVKNIKVDPFMIWKLLLKKSGQLSYN